MRWRRSARVACTLRLDALGAVCAHAFDVDRRGDNIGVCEGELGALHDDTPVQCDYRKAVVVKPVAVAVAELLQFKRGRESRRE